MNLSRALDKWPFSRANREHHRRFRALDDEAIRRTHPYSTTSRKAVNEHTNNAPGSEQPSMDLVTAVDTVLADRRGLDPRHAHSPEQAVIWTRGILSHAAVDSGMHDPLVRQAYHRVLGASHPELAGVLGVSELDRGEVRAANVADDELLGITPWDATEVAEHLGAEHVGVDLAAVVANISAPGVLYSTDGMWQDVAAEAWTNRAEAAGHAVQATEWHDLGDDVVARVKVDGRWLDLTFDRDGDPGQIFAAPTRPDTEAARPAVAANTPDVADPWRAPAAEPTGGRASPSQVRQPHTVQGRTEDSDDTVTDTATDTQEPYVGTSRGRRDATEVGSVLDQPTGDVITDEGLAGLGVTAEEFETRVDAEAEHDAETAAQRCDRALHEADAAIQHIDQAVADNEQAEEQDRRVSRWSAEDRGADAINAGQDAGPDMEQDWS